MQFVEIKGSVFKKFEKNNLFQMSNSGMYSSGDQEKMWSERLFISFINVFNVFNVFNIILTINNTLPWWIWVFWLAFLITPFSVWFSRMKLRSTSRNTVIPFMAIFFGVLKQPTGFVLKYLCFQVIESSVFKKLTL